MTSWVDEHLRIHHHLWFVCKQLPEDYEPWGQNDRGVNYACDCSCGCRFYVELAGPAGADWGVCANPASHRVGLLTFEHQGCDQFEPEDDESNPLELKGISE